MRSIRNSLISKRCDVDEKCLFRASGSALIGWGLQGCKIRCMVFHSSLGLLDDKALLKKARLSDLILVLILLPTSHNFFQTLAEPVLCPKYLITFRSFSSFPLIQPGRRGSRDLSSACVKERACPDKISKSELKMSTFSLGSSTLYTTLKGTLLSSFLKAVLSNLFSFSSFLKAGKHTFFHRKGRKGTGRKFGQETAREGEGRIKIVL